ncbi:transposase [Kitasatospora cheerisanensis]|uniref:Transposase n=1 Tax=Kitasatospora cheerisanensis KCTC 2395 TaxID=1348663 RepID=A0A066YHH6_9ACTN|nr:transposase [Kitasatospora cheerisanensis]KDN80587.1 transposase [Kitasatospora cheerisanensis KCTC 2395]
MQVLSAERRELIEVFTGLRPAQFRRLVKAVKYRGGQALDPSRPGRPWALSLEDRVLLVAVYYRTNLTMRQLGPLFGVSPAATHRIIDRHSPFLALARSRRHPTADDVVIVDGTLVPTQDRSVAAPSKNYQHSANLQILIDAHTRLVLAVGRPVPGNRNDCQAFADSGVDAACGDAVVLADGAYRGTGTLIPHRRRPGQDLPDWQKVDNRSHRRVRARVEHAISRMKNWKILRACRRRGLAVYWAASGIARMHNLALTG